MKFEASGLSTKAAIIIAFTWLAFCCVLSLFICWGALSAWNLLATSAGWSYAIPISWGTVCGLWLVIIFVNLVFRRKKD